jgi:hypothetical protein
MGPYWGGEEGGTKSGLFAGCARACVVRKATADSGCVHVRVRELEGQSAPDLGNFRPLRVRGRKSRNGHSTPSPWVEGGWR